MLQHKVCCFSKQFLWVLFSGIIAITVGCGGDDKVNDFVNVPNVKLSSLEVVEGGELLYKNDTIYEFDPDISGPYTVNVESESQTSVSLRATLADATSNTLTFIRVAQGENREDIEIPANSGETKAIELVDGLNVIYVRVRNNDVLATNIYSLNIYLPSESAKLSSVDIESNLKSRITYLAPHEDGFDPDSFTYTIEVNESLCDVTFIATPQSRAATVTVDGDKKQLFEVTFLTLDPDVVRPVKVKVKSEDGSSENEYTFNLRRKQPSSGDMEADARIKSVDIGGGRTRFPFICDGSSFTQVFSNPETSTSITVALSGTGGSVTLGNAVFNEDDEIQTEENNSSLLLSQNDVTLTPGEAYSGALLQDLEEGNNAFVLRVTPGNNGTKRTYLFNAYRSDRNIVYVSSAVELQAALLGAEPNDQIFVDAGEYVGEVGEEISGFATAHFYSNASGLAATEDEEAKPIELVGVNQFTTLMGDDKSVNDVLRIEGSHWVIDGFKISGAQNGIVLNGASDNKLLNLEVTDVGERGVILQNGSNNNAMRGLVIDKTGRMPQVREGIDEVYGEGVVIGGADAEAVNQGNAFRYMRFGQKIGTEAVDLKANAVETDIQFSTFLANNIEGIADEARTLVSVAGTGEMVMNYNQVEYRTYAQGANPVQTFMNINADNTAHLEFYQNNFDLSAVDIPLIANSDAAVIDVADNVRSDGGAVKYTGTVNQDFDTPIYQIQSYIDETKCLAKRELVMTSSNTSVTNDIVLMADCDAEDPLQQWQFVHDKSGFLLVTLAQTPDFKLSPGAVLQPITSETNRSFEVLFAREDAIDPPADVLNEAYFLRWVMLFEDDSINLVNRSRGTYLTEVDLSFEDSDYTVSSEDNLLTTAALGAGNSQVFTLIRL
ncbi:hypothetical protein TDB9533_01542 [Thalassocella blandensis]|nr:hypothetical protein TDB9533_01542 [Thalassocella blandensis]